MINGKRFWIRKADGVNDLETEHQMFSERKEKT